MKDLSMKVLVYTMFDASATCEGPNASDSYQFFPDPDDV